MNYDTRFVERQQGMRKEKKAQSLNQRLVYCKRSAAFDAKTRFGLPDSFDLGDDPAAGFEIFISLVNSTSQEKAA